MSSRVRSLEPAGASPTATRCRDRGTALARVASALLLLLAIGCQSGPPPSLVDLGDAAFAKRNWAEADAFYARALAANAHDPGAHFGRARVATQQRKPEQALRHFSALARADRAWFEGRARDDYAVALIEAGRSRMARRDPKAALAVMRVAYTLRPGEASTTNLYAKALSGTAASHAMHGRGKQALTLYDEAMKAAPHDVDAYVGKAEILLAVGNKKEALALLIDARERAPSDPRVRALTVEAMGLY